jgi:hypothetical protein
LILICLENDDVLMVRQFCYPVGREVHELPAGKIDAGEDVPANCWRKPAMPRKTGNS